MSRESKLDQRAKELIGVMVRNGAWTPEEKAEYDDIIRERTNLMMAILGVKK